ncbi:type III secretion system HrpP C-terminal domain-containing protein [Pseudomonas sp. R5-89-07]|uniref:type III secretion system HrpP C-terminal domain-containing protein n=1 Tax=Pseudomonas sp. R5-89-07 TaxID=658644 RepID=UPI000F57FE81|nr:type III secretion system HrpP C-terminal domain-containing protein [Pseudomonas sp. R5-89-07]AZF03502.1 type III secretion protein HrpP [Pseudomonas sp. R5-89-07]
MTSISANTPERHRRRDSREDRVHEVGAPVPWEQRQLFTRLFGDDEQGSGRSASQAGTKASGDLAMVEALTEQLVPRLQSVSTWPLTVAMYLPRLGRINARIRRERVGWNIELEAQQKATTSWLCGVRHQCEHRLAASLALPVELCVANSAPA